MGKFALYSSKIDRKKLQKFLNPIIDGETDYESPQEMAIDLHNKMAEGLFYPDGEIERMVKQFEGK